MSVRRRKWRDPVTGAPKEVWMVDIVFEHADGREQRVRKVAFVPRYMEGHVLANRLKASSIAGRRSRRTVIFAAIGCSPPTTDPR